MLAPPREPSALDTTCAFAITLALAATAGCGPRVVNLVSDDDAGPTCLEAGAPCLAGANCCTGRCFDDGAGTGACAAGDFFCTTLGGACTVAVDCCSLGCDGASCVEAPCRIAGAACDVDARCCSNDCVGGVCAAAGGCGPAGEDCNPGGPSSCCTELCVTVEPGVRRCGAGGNCRASGEICTAATDCCTRRCTAGRCEASAGCLVAGEPCGGGGDCCSDTCADDGSGFRSCQLSGGCLPAGEICSIASECCSVECLTGTSACAP